MSTLRTVRLYGVLGSKFGRVHRFALDSGTVSEAMQALCSQLAGFRAFMAQAKDHGLTFAVFAGKRNLAEDELNAPTGSDDIRVAPVLIGSKNGGVFQTILGVVLIVVGVVFQQYYLIGSGIAMAAGGIVQMLSPQVKAGRADSPNNQPSYVFNGAVNTQAQGNPVPVLYGRMIVGSAVISAGIEADDYAAATAGVGVGVSGGSNASNYYQAA
jgi:predicted phage tail protein